MTALDNSGRIGCLCIGEITSGTSEGSGRFHLRSVPGQLETVTFNAAGGGDLWERLQEALLTLRRCPGGVALAGRGTGCAAALALAAQLPVERVALVEPVLALPAVKPAAARRLMRFARRNLSLCACDILVVAGEGCRDVRAVCAANRYARGRRVCLWLPAQDRGEMLINRENTVNQAISYFLRVGELPKKLAQNPEMCIIYG